ncbi:MAG: hypothetical protein LBN20_03480 [Endomicrobium sp.]|jgi:flagellar biosynthesis chaperone FliJ|nr:hypothetical protein [Endomicrobium sp.]
MKKTISAAVCMLFLMSAIAGAIGNFEADTFSFKYDKAQLSEMRKEYNNYKREIKALAGKYNKAASQDKAAIRADIVNLVSARTDKEAVHKKELVNKVQTQIKEIETNKNGYVNKKVDFFLSPEGQKSLNSIRNQKKTQNKKK